MLDIEDHQQKKKAGTRSGQRVLCTNENKGWGRKTSQTTDARSHPLREITIRWDDNARQMDTDSAHATRRQGGCDNIEDDQHIQKIVNYLSQVMSDRLGRHALSLGRHGRGGRGRRGGWHISWAFADLFRGGGAGFGAVCRSFRLCVHVPFVCP